MNVRAQQALAIVRVRRQMGIARPRRRIPKQVWPKLIATEYARGIVSEVTRVRRLLQPLFDELPQLLPQRRDAGPNDRLRGIIDESMVSTNIAELETLSHRMGLRTSEHQKQQLGRQAQAALGVDLLLTDTGIAGLLQNFVAANVSLIRGLTQQTALSIEKTITRAFQDGTLHRDLARQLNDQFDIAEDRSKLIARDQVGKLYSQINRIRQEDLGITSFIWQTVNDNRVRPEHKARHGKTYSYSAPPGGELPGYPINCRCYPEPDFSDLLGDL